MNATISNAHLFPCEVCAAPGVMVLDAKVTRVIDRGLETERTVSGFDYSRPGHVRCAAHCGTSGERLAKVSP